MEVKAQLNGLRIAPRKVRLVVGLIKKKDVDAVLAQLAHMSNRASRPVAKTIASAIANAEHNHRMVRSNLYVKNAWVDEGVALRRWRAKGFGRAARMDKKTSHVSVVLDERVAGIRAEQAPAKKEEPKASADGSHPEAAPAKESTEKTRTAPKKPVTEASKPAKGLKGFGKRLFRRKSI